MEGLVDGSLGVKREAGIHLSRDLAGDNLQNLLAEFDKQTVDCGVDLVVKIGTLPVMSTLSLFWS